MFASTNDDAGFVFRTHGRGCNPSVLVVPSCRFDSPVEERGPVSDKKNLRHVPETANVSLEEIDSFFESSAWKRGYCEAPGKI